MVLGKLKQAFLENAGVRFVFDHCEKIAASSFVAGHLVLIGHSGLHPNTASAAGLFFILADLTLSKAKKHPVAAFRLCGLLGTAGAAFLSAGGINFDTMQIENGWRVLSPLFALPTMTIIGMQHEIAEYAEKLAHAKSSLARKFSAVSRYPLLLSAASGIVCGTGLLVSAVIDQNAALMTTLALWAIGGTAMIMSDPRLQKMLREEKEPDPVPVSSPAAPPAP